jgi:hypothetical protein
MQRSHRNPTVIAGGSLMQEVTPRLPARMQPEGGFPAVPAPLSTEPFKRTPWRLPRSRRALGVGRQTVVHWRSIPYPGIGLKPDSEREPQGGFTSKP